MLTREEIAEIVQYCKEKGVSYKSRLKEIGIAEWRFYESKRRYAEAQASERESGEFLQLVRGNDSFPEPVLTDRKTGKGRKSGQESIPMSIEMRTQTGAGGIADPGQSGRGDDTGNNPGVVEPCLA